MKSAKYFVNDDCSGKTIQPIFDAMPTWKYLFLDECGNVVVSKPNYTESKFKLPLYNYEITEEHLQKIITEWKKISGKDHIPDPEKFGVIFKNVNGSNVFAIIM